MLRYKFQNIEFFFEKTPQGQELINEIFGDNYRIFKSQTPFNPGDIILDFGACEGMFSIMMAKVFPGVHVHAFEPVVRTYFKLLRNIGLNGVSNITTHNIGVGAKEEKVTMYMGLDDWSGGSSTKLTFDPTKQEKTEVQIVPLDSIFKNLGIEKCRLMKMDIEGMEYEALYNCTILDKVEYFCGEFHINQRIGYDGYRMDGLANWVNNRTKIIAIQSCGMAE